MCISPTRFLFLIFIGVITLAWNPVISLADAPGEYRVKAAFLYHFANFVDWPLSAFQATDGRLRVCIIGKDPFGQTLEDTLAKKTVRDHPFEIQRNPTKTELQHCHILYLPSSGTSKIKTLRHHVAKGDVLTVGENLDFIKQGGMVKFFVEDQKVRFAINPDAVYQTKMKMSSKLLRLAKIVSP